MLTRIISFFKGRTVTIDSKVPNSYILSITLEKSFSLLRGMLKTGKFIFLGRGTKIRACSHFFAEKGSEIASHCQIDCLGKQGLLLGQGSKIGSYSILRVTGTISDIGEKIEIGRNVGIGDFAHIGGAGPVYIGNDSIIGAYLSVHPENHNFRDTSKPIRLQGVTRKGVKIGQGCWIGAKVTFVDGSAIGDGCVVAAGAVVTKVFPDYVLIGGVPAKIIRNLKEDD